jgi:acyl carrier protein
MEGQVTHDEVERVSRLVEQVLDSPGTRPIGEDTRFDELGMQSINRIMLATLVEQEFGVDLEQRMTAVVQLLTVGELVRFLRSEGITT